jgi:hypothetical protein
MKMNRTFNNIACLLALLGANHMTAYATSAAPVRIALSMNGKSFHTYDMAFSSDGNQVCITGKDINEMGTSAPHLILVDRAHRATLWQHVIALPESVATAYPVQCLIGKDRVYLLTNDDTSLSPPQSTSSTYLYAFDLHGNRLASMRLAVPGKSQYGYTMAETSDGVTIAGYTMDADERNEQYATFTLFLDTRLQTRGIPLQRRNGAFASPFSARLVEDSLYITGTFFPSTVPTDSLGSFKASRVKVNGGYVWSTTVAHVDDVDVRFAVAADGTSYALSVGADSATLSTIGPDGKVRAPSTQRGTYCSVGSLARYGDGVAAVLKPCKGKPNQLVTIPPPTGKQPLVKALPDEPLYIATKDALWGVLSRDTKGKTYLTTGVYGEL